MIYGLVNLFNLLLILFRFFIFSQYVDSSSLNAQNYSFFAFCNVIIPFILIGISFGQNAVYARFFKNNNNQGLIVFYNLALVIISISSLLLFGITFLLDLNKIYAFSFTQFSLNFFYQQKRYEENKSIIIFSLTEIIGISFLIIFLNNPTSRFEYLFIFYSLIISYGIIDRFNKLKFKSNISINFINIKFNIKNMLYVSPMFIKDNIDIILLGLTTREIIASKYALVILSSVPSKILLSTLQITINKYFADKNIYYNNIFSKLNNNLIIISLILNAIIPVVIIYLFFTDTSNDIYFASIIRSTGLIAGFKMRASYLDTIQIETEGSLNNYKKGILLSLIFVLFSYPLFSLFPSIYLLSTLPLLISMIANTFYKLSPLN